ncbi:molybdopterin molybdenumtransferase MoeA [Rhodoferax koreense]|uniref:Molybdopterin molybdenumtransferase n=1 Tax=Rhodoferax koreensis TaxID=1842727 RepID=A0A1P8K3F7_9BURK|nr:gephyrin-like molybdotransferase Glp [Rhodoferax koreense]APW40528.1 molybdopterin molybdenumtransferase MoeA [Rhodoferax koreense]
MTPQPMKSLDDAMAELLAQAAPLTQTESVSTFDADGRVLSRDVVSPLQVPPMDNSAMDGYAVRCADLPAAGTVLPVSQRIAAGAVGTDLAPGTVARIFTGAPVPSGADAVVMQEDCEVMGEPVEPGGAGLGAVRIQRLPVLGKSIRRAGEDVALGAVVLPKGTRLTPAELGLAASIGMDALPVVARPRVALFSTGDELVMPGAVPPDQMKPGAIYNSNRFFLRALLQRLGCVITDFGIVPDQRAATLQALRDASLAHDLILTSGGVSVGEEDHVKPAVQELGELNLWQIAIKPGKPFAYGKIHSPIVKPGPEGAPCHFIGLPGNPVSSFITFVLLVRPFLLKLQGVQRLAPVPVALPAHFDWPRADKRREFLRVRRNAAGGVELFRNQSSGVLTSTVWGDGVVDVPPGHAIVQGETVQFISFAELLA